MDSMPEELRRLEWLGTSRLKDLLLVELHLLHCRVSLNEPTNNFVFDLTLMAMEHDSNQNRN